MSKVITLDDDAHIYAVDGLITPGVSEILHGAGLVDDRWFTESACWRGTQVHALCQFDNEGDLDEAWIDEQENAAELRGYLRAHRRFKDETGFYPTHSEERVYNPTLNYCGTLDERGTLDGKLCLADIKSGAVSRITRYQLVAYLGCFGEPWLWTRLAVGLKSNGSYSLKVYGAKDYRHDWQTWTSIVETYRLRMSLGMIDPLNRRKETLENEHTEIRVGIGGELSGITDEQYFRQL